MSQIFFVLNGISKMVFVITVHGVATQGKQVDVMEYVTEYKLSSTMDGIIWNLYKENQIVKVCTL